MSDHVDTLLEAARLLRETPELREALRHVTDRALELVDATQSSLRILDRDGERLLVSARSGPSMHVSDMKPFVRGEGVIGWVVEEGRPALVTDTATDPRFTVRPEQVDMPASIVAAPLFSSRGCMGVLSLARMEPPPFAEQDMRLLTLMAELAAPYLDLARLAVLSQTDDLTLLYNRRYLDDVLPREIDRARRYGHPLSLMMIDLDHFKEINDRHGHAVGDEILRGMGDRLRAFSRYADVSARWGGEEFLVLLIETDEDKARQVAERLRQGIGELGHETSAGPLTVTLSIGVAALGTGDTASSMLRRADEALYRAKRGGRNRVE
jgi:diguanylate cyclase (GGDEF)-like protein